MSDGYYTVSGNVTYEPRRRVGKESGTPFTTFGLAENRSRYDSVTGESVPLGTHFYEVVAFRSLGANAADSLKVGDPVVVHGRLKIDDWDNGERQGTSVQIDASSIGHDLTFGTSTYAKRRRVRPPSQDRVATELGGPRIDVRTGEVLDEAVPPQDAAPLREDLDGGAGDDAA
jgi:single-strand DNA-binding protein